jgi:hypothetical protein
MQALLNKTTSNMLKNRARRTIGQMSETRTNVAMPSTVSQPNRQVAVFHGRTKVLPLTIFAMPTR